MSKSIIFPRPFGSFLLLLLYALVWWRTFAYFARFSYGGEKCIISTAYFIPTAKIHLPFRLSFQRLVRVFVQTGLYFPVCLLSKVL